jgi:hypothetical protein
MTHLEYTLTLANDVDQTNGTTTASHYKKGDRVTVDQATFEALKRGETITRAISYEAQVSYNYRDFENEVSVLKITTEFGIAKLGNRKK